MNTRNGGNFFPGYYKSLTNFRFVQEKCTKKKKNNEINMVYYFVFYIFFGYNIEYMLRKGFILIKYFKCINYEDAMHVLIYC